jgi:hypothetical protein
MDHPVGEIQDVMPSWIPAYKMTKKTDIQNGSLSYRMVGYSPRTEHSSI